MGIQTALLQVAEGDGTHLDEAFRLVHTLKGNAAMVGLGGIVASADALEDAIESGDVDDMLRTAAALASAMPMDEVRHKPPVRVASTVDLDALTNAANELSILRNRLLTGGDVQALDRVVDRVHRGVMSMRLQRVGPVLDRVRITAMEAARALGRRVRVEVEAGDVSLERDHLGPIGEVLGHLARNAVDHGIEPEGARRESGKNPMGLVRVSCRLEGEDAIIEVADDGAGLDLEGLADLVPDVLAEDAIFHPGVSTRPAATETSGRGVGLDAVRSTVARLGGTVAVQSQRGQGTTFTLRVPRRLSLESCLVADVGDETWLVPVAQIGRITTDGKRLQALDGSKLTVSSVGAIVPVPVQPVPAWLRAPTWVGFAILPDGRPAPVVNLVQAAAAMPN